MADEFDSGSLNDNIQEQAIRSVSDPKGELLSSGWKDKGTRPCNKCKEQVQQLESPSGTHAYFDEDGKMHSFTCGNKYPVYNLPPIPDQAAYIAEQEKKKS